MRVFQLILLLLLLAAFTFYGLPVSTTHTKTTAIMGVGAAKRLTNVNWSVAKKCLRHGFLTFPGCGLIGYVMAQIFLKLFA